MCIVFSEMFCILCTVLSLEVFLQVYSANCIVEIVTLFQAVKQYRKRWRSLGSFLCGSSLCLPLCLDHSLHLFALSLPSCVTPKLQGVETGVAGEFSKLLTPYTSIL